MSDFVTEVLEARLAELRSYAVGIESGLKRMVEEMAGEHEQLASIRAKITAIETHLARHGTGQGDRLETARRLQRA